MNRQTYYSTLDCIKLTVDGACDALMIDHLSEDNIALANAVLAKSLSKLSRMLDVELDNTGYDSKEIN